MTWIVTDDINGTVNVRAVLHVPTEQQEIRNLIAALQKRVKDDQPANQETPNV